MLDTYVLDCSVAAKWVLPESGRDAARDYYDRYVSGNILLIAPDILVTEFASLVAKRNRRGHISAAQAQQAFAMMTRIAPRLFHTPPLLFHALELSLKHQLSLWDCIYLALGLERDCPVLTADHRLFRGGSSRHPALMLVQ